MRLGPVSIGAAHLQGGQRNVEFVHDALRLISQSNITMKLAGKAIDEACPETAPSRLRTTGPPLSVHVSFNRSALSSTIDVMLMRPVVLDNAPYLTAFVHSSSRDIVSGSTASEAIAMSVS